MSTELVHVPVPGADVPMRAAMVDGQPFVALKPRCEAIGVDMWSQTQVQHQLYGWVNSWPAWVWDLAADGFTS